MVELTVGKGAHFGPVAQLVEHLTFNQRVPGSSPGQVTKKLRRKSGLFLYLKTVNMIISKLNII